MGVDTATAISVMADVVFVAFGIPLTLDYIKGYEKRKKERGEVNKDLYNQLYKILVKLVVDEYKAHDESPKKKLYVSNKRSEEHDRISPLYQFISENYETMAQNFPMRVTNGILSICEEYENDKSVTRYCDIRDKVSRCIRALRREIGERDIFYFDTTFVNILCDK